MVQKVIKIGSSVGVTIPKKQLDELGLSLGDEVSINIKPANSQKKHAQLMKEYDKFVEQYGQTLKSLARR